MVRKAIGDAEDISAGEDESLYENLDHLKDLIHSGDERSERDEDEGSIDDEGHDSMADKITPSDLDSDEEYRDDALLAEFSDYGEVSDDNDNDDEQDFMDAIREANNFKVKKRRGKGAKKEKAPKRERPVDPEIAQLLSEANEAFVRSDLPVAERLFNEVIKKDPRNFAAYETLGDIYQLQGRLNDCCNSWFLAAHINSSDIEFWKVVAILSADLEHYRQAIYCFSRVINLNKQDWETVYRRATLYKKIGQTGKALEGFQKIYASNPYDANILRELAVLNVDYDRPETAVELYMNVFKDNVKRRKAIIDAFENAVGSSDEDNDTSDDEEDEDDEEDLDQNAEDETRLEEMRLYPGINWRRINRKFQCIPFDWSSLNIVAELLLKIPGRVIESINTIKMCARWIEHREFQTFWDNAVDDTEFDDRRLKNSRYDSLSDEEKEKSYTLPIDIRIRLGLLRLENENILEALNHFQFLYDENFAEVSDLNYEVGLALTKAEKCKEAIDFFIPLLSLAEFCKIELYENLGKCYKETEDYELAREFYAKVVELDPGSLEHKLNLAEIHYYLGNTDIFRVMLKEVKEARKKQEEELYKKLENPLADRTEEKETRKGKEMEPEEEFDEENTGPKDISTKPLLEDSMFRQFHGKRKKTPQDIEREKVERERKITLKVVDKFLKLKDYEDAFVLGDMKGINKWIDIVSDLVDVFSSVKNFFVRSRSKKFVGIIRRTKKFNTILDYQLERLSKLSDGDSLSDGMPVMEERVTLTSTTELRGLSYGQWFELFMELALTLTKYHNVQDGLSVIDTAQEVNVFCQDPSRVKMMKFVKLAIILQMDEEEELAEHLRNLLNQFQFNRKVFQLFMYSLSKGECAFNILSSTVQQKFFLRQVKAFDSCRYGTHVNGQASITNKKVVNPDKKGSPYLHYIYAVLLYSSRGYLSALQYLSLLEEEIPDDPMVNLLMGLSHLQRSTQRLTASRHFQVLHALRYLYRYHDIRSGSYTELEKQEADYNIGRAFHLIGLVSTAVAYYTKVLENYEDDQLKKHAAYNCIIIYQESGNSQLANSIMAKYLSV
ncbi:transcription factor TFIIIC subunit TFC4 KNAG_0C00550 [Huiozyma naganishii CBS 8797]|uniref:Transcription factor tau 131 kDa subunit n=1 Tax=Huiozyma naganishii (strain ATCC MYA-139 / BCRC 22969 / CBS 8797 / KCTC 17520 / NBRC 10181 / NCYC 3082 / Yp74L-3) TaxID=1071383 RepID=J7S498_HUIN7|nr:hypothetical protein KNAG_0C00550 [Kazachstania naganishii CBS 8797]CCK69169.1 hypothetical protein KNAG_0C00550 [Kazachstania naganishii CBS 8797]